MYKSKALVVSILIMLIANILLEAGAVSPESEQAYDGENKQEPGKVVILLADYASLEDLRSCSNIGRLFETGSLSLVSNRLTGGTSLHKSRLAYAAGRQLTVDAGMLNAGNAARVAKDYFVNIGHSTYPANVAYLDIANLKNRNKAASDSSGMGLIGDAVHSSNKKTCVLGNSDGVRTDRSAVFMAMDSSGLVDYGDIDDILTADASFPGGKRTDYNRLAELYKQYLPACSLLVLDTGDLARLEQYKRYLSREQYAKFRSQILAWIDGLSADILEADQNITLVITSTYSPAPGKSTNPMSPILVHDSGIGGTLYSDRTRREGIIANMDFAGLILDRLGMEDRAQVVELPHRDNYNFIRGLQQKCNTISAMRAPVLKAYTILVMLTLVLVSLLFLNNRFKKSVLLRHAAKLLLLTDLIIPYLFLYVPVSIAANTALYAVLCFSIAALLSVLLSFAVHSSLDRFIIICFSITSGLVIDVMCGSPYIKQSVLGYDPIIGARFYGIGNEYIGVFLGSSLAFIGCILEKYRQWKHINRLRIHSVWLMLFLTCIAGLPFWGANFGGAIALLTGFFIMYALINGIKLHFKAFLALFILLALSSGLITVIDLSGKDNYTHIGRLAIEIRDKGMTPLYTTAVRKVSMNLRLIRYTIWTKVLMCIIAAVTILFFKPVGLLGRVFVSSSYLKRSWIGISSGSIAGFAANDSGIVLASTAMIFLSCTLLYICIEEISAKTGI